MNMAGYLSAPPKGPHSHFPTHPGLGSGLGSGLAPMPMPAIGPFGIPHALEPVPFPQGKYYDGILIIIFIYIQEILDTARKKNSLRA